MRLTALLLGQLSADEAAAMRQALAADPELQRWHDRLRQTIGLVREAVGPAGAGPSLGAGREAGAEGETTPATPAEPLRLSADRRAALLASFKTVGPEELERRTRRQTQRRELYLVAAMLLGLMLVASVFVAANATKARSSAQRPSIGFWAARPEQDFAVTVAAPAEVSKETAPAPKGGLEGAVAPANDRYRAYFGSDPNETPVSVELGRSIALPSGGAAFAGGAEGANRASIVRADDAIRPTDTYHLWYDTSADNTWNLPAPAKPAAPPAALAQLATPVTASPAPASPSSFAAGTTVAATPAEPASGLGSGPALGRAPASGREARFARIELPQSVEQTTTIAGKPVDVPALAEGDRRAEPAVTAPAPMPPAGAGGRFGNAIAGGAGGAGSAGGADKAVRGANFSDVFDRTELKRVAPDDTAALASAGRDEAARPQVVAGDFVTGPVAKGLGVAADPTPPVIPPPAATAPPTVTMEINASDLSAAKRRVVVTNRLAGAVLEDEVSQNLDARGFAGLAFRKESKPNDVDRLSRKESEAERSGERELARAKEKKLADTIQEADKVPAAPQEQQQLAKLERLEDRKQSGRELEELSARRPAPSAPVPQPEVVTAENPFSTFSLNVTDVSFKLAAASLEKGQMPDPASVRTEEFINAFDYRDPEPVGRRRLAFHWERARYPFAHNRDLLRFSVKTAASGRSAGQPLNVVLLLDNSGSMERADRQRIRRECLRVLAAQLRPSDRVSVVAFARTARLWVDGMPGTQAGELVQRVGQLTPDGGTNLEEAMALAYQTAKRHFQAGGINRVVLLTDGAANLGDVDPASLQRGVEAQRREGVALDCFGIGWDGYNDELLETLSRHGDGRYGFINTPEAAATEFAGQLAGALQVAASDVKVQVQFNPRRVTAYRQMGYAKHQLTKEQFRDNTVDAAEIGAAEAGNALYVVEVNPAGDGPLGVARVRFRVPGSGEYHEQEWTLAYDGSARVFDQAAPALRLAGVAAAFSEWLVASPFAGEVTVPRLQGHLAGLPGMPGIDPRVKQLETMLRLAGGLGGK